MKVFRGIDEAARASAGNLVIALGNFDGVHIGHQYIIKRAVEQAGKRGLKSAVLTFDPHPAQLLHPYRPVLLLTDIEERLYRFGLLGVDCIIIEPFTPQLASLSPEGFVTNKLTQQLNISGLVVGYDYTFGYKGRGKAEDLYEFGLKYGFTVDICNPISLNGRVASSSLVRELIKNGNLTEVTRFLNYYLPRKGKVIKGKGRGKLLGFPTANLAMNPELIWPHNGVYLTAVQIEERDDFLFGLANIGVRPTFEGYGKSLEVYILGLNKSLYNQEVKVLFLQKLRDERAFRNKEELIKQIKQDINTGQNLIKHKFKNITCAFLQ